MPVVGRPRRRLWHLIGLPKKHPLRHPNTCRSHGASYLKGVLNILNGFRCVKFNARPRSPSFVLPRTELRLARGHKTTHTCPCSPAGGTTLSNPAFVHCFPLYHFWSIRARFDAESRPKKSPTQYFLDKPGILVNMP